MESDKNHAVPSFIVGGAGRTGTSWLHKCLREHPNIFVPNRKELNFFSENWDKGEDWYEKCFKGRKSEKEIGEVSPSYLSTENVAHRIYEYNPRVKLIFIFRDPVERAYSEYCQRLRQEMVSKEILKEINEESEIVKGSIYYENLKKFLSYFEDGQIEIKLYEDLDNDPRSFLSSIYSFLEVDEQFVPKIVEDKFHRRKPPPKVKKIHSFLKKISSHIKSSGHTGKRIFEYVNGSILSDYYNKLNQDEDVPSLPTEKKQKLVEFFSEDVDKLSKCIGTNLRKKWLKKYE